MLLRLGFWSLAIIVGATARGPARERLRGYVDFLRFLLGRGRPLPYEFAGGAT